MKNKCTDCYYYDGKENLCIHERPTFIDDICTDYQDNEFVKQIRAEVIDECIQVIDDVNWIESEHYINLLKQLKEQNNTCFDCKYHFMSDCYLECQIKDRINNDNICKNFEQLKEQK